MHYHAMHIHGCQQYIRSTTIDDNKKWRMNWMSCRDQQATSSSTSSQYRWYLMTMTMMTATHHWSNTWSLQCRPTCNQDPNTHNDNYRFDHDLIYYNNRLLVPNDNDIKENYHEDVSWLWISWSYRYSKDSRTSETIFLLEQHWCSSTDYVLSVHTVKRIRTPINASWVYCNQSRYQHDDGR